jgi:hypothetical protein
MKQAKKTTVIPIAKPSILLETIDPQKAKEMLATSAGNRSISEVRVDGYAEAILNGDWKGWAAPIQVNTRGQLINGHHRLHAVIVANQAIEQCVARNLPDDTIEAIDLGRARTLADVLSMPTKHYVANGVALAALINSLHTLLDGQRAMLTPATVTRYREAVGEQYITAGLRWYARLKRSRTHNPCPTAAALLLLYRTDGSDQSLQFCEHVSECIGVPGDPAYTVIRYLTTKGRGISPHEVLSRLAGAHQAAVAGRSLERSARADEAAVKYRNEATEGWGGIALGIDK